MLKRLIGICRETVFPTRCNGCQRLYRSPARGSSQSPDAHLDASFADWVGDYFCEACVRAAWVESPLCTQCGQPFVSTHGPDHLCGGCTKAPFSFDAARAAGTYEHALRSLVQDFKYRGREYLAEPLGRLLWATLLKYWLPADFDWIVPVPLHHRRLWRRGFNQAGLLLRCWPGLAGETGVAFDRRKIAHRMLIRQRHTPSQTGLDRRQREANLRQAFELADAGGVGGSRILIVDDVLTTGATADACSRVLKRAGAVSVKVLTLARAV